MENLFNDEFTSLELEAALGATKKNKSAGPDEILPEFLIFLGPLARSVVLKFLNKVWKTHYPCEWRKARIIPILKKNRLPDKPENFRPISLTSVFSKVFERMLLNRLKKVLESRNLISEAQAGFRKHRSTIEHVAHFSQEVKDAFQRQQSVVAVFVDFKTAFDRVWRRKLLDKLVDMDIRGNMFRAIASFLAQRFISVKYQDSMSHYKQTKQGVPQGSVLSPTLFNIMIDDVTKAMGKIPGIYTLLYADDLVIWCASSRVKAMKECINNALDVLAKWAQENEMIISTEKTVFQLFSLSTKNYDLQIKYNGIPLPRTESATYLGVSLDSKLHWTGHIGKMIEKGEKRLQLLKRLTATTWGATQDVLTLAYNTYVRPAVEYGGEVLITASGSNLNKIDLFQNKALRLITGGAKSTPINSMQLQLEMESLANRREMAAITLHEKMQRLGGSYWREYKPPAARLKTQTSFTRQVLSTIQGRNIEIPARQNFPSVTNHQSMRVARTCLNLIREVKKKVTPEYEARAIALESIHTWYPQPEWFHVYTDGSAQAATRNAGAGVFSVDFSLSAPVGKLGTNYDGEVAAMVMALNAVLDKEYTHIVIFVDSQAAIQAMTSQGFADAANILEGQSLVTRMLTEGKHIVFQWIPSHCGIIGNERADELAKQGASGPQPDVAMPLTSFKRYLKCIYKEKLQEHLKQQAVGKQWETLVTCRIPVNLPRKVAVACFRAATGHDYLQCHLNRIGIKDSPQCALCQGGVMDFKHLDACPALLDVRNGTPASESSYVKNSILYWAARNRMAEAAIRIGVG